MRWQRCSQNRNRLDAPARCKTRDSDGWKACFDADWISVTRLWLFLSSLAPACLVVGIRLLGSEWLWGAVLLLCGALLFPVAYFVLRTRRSVTPKPVKVSDIRDESYQVPTYLLTFIFPFLFIDIEDFWNAASYIVLILFVAILLFRSDLSLVNPALLMLGYHIYVIQAEGGEDLLLITKTRPRVGLSISATLLSGHTYLLNRSETERMNA